MTGVEYLKFSFSTFYKLSFKYYNSYCNIPEQKASYFNGKRLQFQVKWCAVFSPTNAFDSLIGLSVRRSFPLLRPTYPSIDI